MAMKMDVWQWGDVKGVDEELCNNLALFAEDNKIDCMNMTEKEFVALKDEYLMINYGNKGVFSKKSMKERYEYHVDDITDIIRSNGVLFDSCNILDDYGWDIEHGKITWLSKHAYDEISIAYANCIQYLKDEYDGKKKDELIDDLTKFFDKVISLTESKKSVRKSIKEGKDSAFYDGIAKEFHFSKDEKTRYKDKTYISAIAVLFDRINNAIKTYGRNSDEEYNALNDCWEVISSAKQNGFNVDYDEDRWNKIAGLPNYH